MAVDPFTAAMELGNSVIERIWPDANKRAEEMRKLRELEQEGDLEKLNQHIKLLLGQIEINKLEAQSQSKFKSGWRPFIGWVCGLACAWNWIGLSLSKFLLTSILAFLASGTANEVGITTVQINAIIAQLEPASLTEMLPLLFGMLGLGGYRTFEKVKGKIL